MLLYIATQVGKLKKRVIREKKARKSFQCGPVLIGATGKKYMKAKNISPHFEILLPTCVTSIV